MRKTSLLNELKNNVFLIVKVPKLLVLFDDNNFNQKSPLFEKTKKKPMVNGN